MQLGHEKIVKVCYKYISRIYFKYFHQGALFHFISMCAIVKMSVVIEVWPILI
jgi:hypothetical protein